MLLGGYSDVSWLYGAFEAGRDVNRKTLNCELYKEKELN